MLDALERMLANGAAGDPSFATRVMAEAGRIVETAPPEQVARINREVGELLERHGIMPENPGAAG